LEEKKKLIDAVLKEMNGKLTELNKLVVGTDGSLKEHTEVTTRLHKTTTELREALASPQRRGQWGERMAEDVLRLAGLVEHVNYEKQQPVAGGARPDYTFHLPDRRHVHMDVKFPLDNYLKVLDAQDDTARRANTAQFLRDVRNRIKEITTRGYIDPAAGTVDYVLVFIPNEQVYGFIHEHDSGLMDDAMRHKVVLCSPMTLYAILAVIRQSVENFHLEQSSRRILELLAEFSKQWTKYVDVMDKMGARLDAAVKEYQELTGVRTRKLERQLDKIDDLRKARLDRVEAAPPALDRPSAADQSVA
ncbi:MAG: DNA recombination protein RmuC, partial [Phycisphaerae bacterium]